MRRTTITVVSSVMLLFSSGCKKCFDCVNDCVKRISTGELICSDQFPNYAAYNFFIDSMRYDLISKPTNYITYHEVVCNEKDKQVQEQKPGITCMSKLK